MSLQAILQVAIGLVFAWLVLSIASMYVQELIVTWLRWRSDMLETYIRNMLADSTIADQFYDHPVIQALHTGGDSDHRPSYIPARQFATAMFDIIVNAGKESSVLQGEIYKLRSRIATLKKDEKARAEAQFAQVLAAARLALNTKGSETVLENALANVKMELEHLANINPALEEAVRETVGRVEIDKSQILAILNGIESERKKAAGKDSSGEQTTTLDQIRDGVAILSVSSPQLSQAFESLLRGAEEYAQSGERGLAQARVSVERWFDDGMDRLSGWYKRRSQKLAIWIGLAVAIVLNADTLALSQVLWREPAIREALVAQAKNYVEQNPNGAETPASQQIETLQAQFSVLNLPIGWVGLALPTDENGYISLPDETQKRCTLFPTPGVDFYGFRIGKNCYPIINAPAPNDLAGILLKLFGLIASGIAAAQGAPFWFDILKKAINIRTSGAKPPEAPDNKAAVGYP